MVPAPQTAAPFTALRARLGSTVQFESLRGLNEPATGEPRIEGIQNGSQAPITTMGFNIFIPPASFTDTIFDMFIGDSVGTAGGTATIFVLAYNFPNPEVFNMPLGT